jgi:hypothetical protein
MITPLNGPQRKSSTPCLFIPPSYYIAVGLCISGSNLNNSVGNFAWPEDGDEDFLDSETRRITKGYVELRPNTLSHRFAFPNTYGGGIFVPAARWKAPPNAEGCRLRIKKRFHGPQYWWVSGELEYLGPTGYVDVVFPSEE